MLPFLVQFLKELETDEDGLVYVNKFKNVLREEMITRCAKNLNIKLLAKSRVFDKRYSKLKFLPRICHLLDVQAASDQIISEIKEELNFGFLFLFRVRPKSTTTPSFFRTDTSLLHSLLTVCQPVAQST